MPSSPKIRKELSKFLPYEWEPSTGEIAASFGIAPAGKIARMDTNTSPYLPSGPLESLGSLFSNLRVNDYPDTSYLDLRSRLSRYCGKGAERFVATNGADEALDIVSKVFLGHSDEAVIPVPTYSMYRIVTEIMGANPVFVRRNRDLTLNPEEIKLGVGRRTKLIFLCSPNNPTGDSISPESAKSIVEGAKDALVVFDEAYYEFTGKTLAGLTDKYDNVAIVRTFSKAFSMAGARVGYVIASKETVNKLNLVRPPNSLSVISLALASLALKDLESMEKNVRKIMSERKRCVESMGKFEGKIDLCDGEANFILFRVRKKGRANRLHSALQSRGIVLRDFSPSSGLSDYLRVTISTRENNDKFLYNLKRLL